MIIMKAGRFGIENGYQKVSFWKDLRLTLSNSEFRPILLHTRDYVFSSNLAAEFKSPKMLWTRFSLCYLHCSLLLEKLESRQQRLFDKEVKLFNTHWGCLMFEVK
jgi:hypothetical protein